jgi:hypothetical protein
MCNIYSISVILSIIIVLVEVEIDTNVRYLEYKEKLDLICKKQQCQDISYLGICFIPIINSTMIILYTLELLRRFVQYVFNNIIKKEKALK